MLRTITEHIGSAPYDQERGVLLETFVFQELQAAMQYRGIFSKLAYWRTHDGSAIDFVWSRAAETVAIEVKAPRTWKLQNHRGFRNFRQAIKRPVKCIGVYMGSEELLRDGVPILPIESFLQRLHAGEILP